MKRYRIRHEQGGGYTIWTCDPISGERRDCIAWVRSRFQALRVVTALTIDAWMTAHEPP